MDGVTEESSPAMRLMRLPRADLITRHQKLSRSRADYGEMTSEQIAAAILDLEDQANEREEGRG